MEELEMKINEFKENNETKKEVMDQKMEALKLENINSMWYFIVAMDEIILMRKLKRKDEWALGKIIDLYSSYITYIDGIRFDKIIKDLLALFHWKCKKSIRIFYSQCEFEESRNNLAVMLASGRYKHTYHISITSINDF